jgi:dihydroorotate dehydrogenase electron transfer subunit
LLRRLDALQGRATIYACGPHGMLNAVATIAAARNIPCQVSLEGYMACGVGACLGCVAPGRGHSAESPDFRCVCTEGPVFESGELKWRD